MSLGADVEPSHQVERCMTRKRASMDRLELDDSLEGSKKKVSCHPGWRRYTLTSSESNLWWSSKALHGMSIGQHCRQNS